MILNFNNLRFLFHHDFYMLFCPQPIALILQPLLQIKFLFSLEFMNFNNIRQYFIIPSTIFKITIIKTSHFSPKVYILSSNYTLHLGEKSSTITHFSNFHYFKDVISNYFLSILSHP